MRWSRSASVSTASRWRSSWPRHGCGHCRSRSCSSACEDRFRLLRGSGRSTLDRHQTLRATVSWSYQLLTDDERLFFDRASVFAGGFDLRAAERCAGSTRSTTSTSSTCVSSLVDKSMIVADRGAVGMRYRLLETLRQYGEDQMELRGETAVVARPPCRSLRRPDRGARLLVRAPRQIEGARISIEWDNLRAAHLWSLANAISTSPSGSSRPVSSTPSSACATTTPRCCERTVELGDECGRPSTSVLGMLSYWTNMQGNEEESRRLAQRGLDVAPSPDHPSTANCWCEFADVTARGGAGIAGGTGRLPTSIRGGGQHTRSRPQLVRTDQPPRRVAER